MKHQRGLYCTSSCCISAVLYFLLGLLLLTNGSYFASANDEDGERTAGYCHLCKHHIMCLFPFDDEALRCNGVENGDLDPEEILFIVHQHNVYRNNIARGLETRGNPGPQPPARNMMELSWDEELALLARRWALQCNLSKKDKCRDVDRFEVWQNVDVLALDNNMEMDAIGVSEDQQPSIEEDGNNTTAFMRIRSHVQSWLKDVERFDTASVGLVDFSIENERSYVAIAGAKITRVGCGRAIYSMDLSESTDEVEGFPLEVQPAPAAAAAEAPQVTSNKNGNNTSRVEVLVCNYGPIDRMTPQNLYESGALQACPEGSMLSNKYDHLCVQTEELRDFSPGDSEDHNAVEIARDASWRGIVGSTEVEEERRRSSGSSAVSIALRKRTSATARSFYALVELLSLVLLHIIIKVPGSCCCWSC